MPGQHNVVIDTNVLVSTLLSKTGPPAQIGNLVLNELLTVFYDVRIWEEYLDVLYRDHFKFNEVHLKVILDTIQREGFDVDPFQLETKSSDPDDQPFYEVAKLCFCPLITGNKKDYPDDPNIMTPAEFIDSMKAY